MMKYNLPLSDILPCAVCSFDDVGELLPCRAKSRIPQNAKSVFVYLFPYLLEDAVYKNSNVSKYAVPRDYHIVAGEYLQKLTEELRERFPRNQFEFFCDNSPINEVEAAVNCGLGVRGLNGLLINEKYGSYCFIGEIVTDLEVECSSVSKIHCMQCGLCVEKCPAGAISLNGVDKNKCLSHITQMKGGLSSENIDLIKNSGCIWGCDVCQDVCPMNKNAAVTLIEEFKSTAVSEFVENGNIEDRAYSWRGRRVIERNLGYIK
ncbi:MAG: epoxyqueuosine reductase [Clostridia bacterium]|nr:epoxyqueuosine reductase [Clostridia bacterium]